MPTDEILSAVYRLLAEAGKPLHYKTQIFPAMVAQQLVTNDFTGESFLYNLIYGDIRKQGENSRFRRSGRGYVVATEDYDPGAHAPAQGNKTTANPNGRVNLAPAVQRICGTCTHICFTGTQELALEFGDCNRYPDSGRPRVGSLQHGCDLWQRRSASDTEKIKARRDELRVLVMGVNMVAQRQTKRRG